MKRKRKLIYFKFKGIHWDNDDFVCAQRTCRIDYKLSGQKFRRSWIVKFNDEFYLDFIQIPDVFAKIILQQFKTSLNIKHTK